MDLAFQKPEGRQAFSTFGSFCPETHRCTCPLYMAEEIFKPSSPSPREDVGRRESVSVYRFRRGPSARAVKDLNPGILASGLGPMGSPPLTAAQLP